MAALVVVLFLLALADEVQTQLGIAREEQAARTGQECDRLALGGSGQAKATIGPPS